MLQEFKIGGKILLVTCDNASNNNMMVEELKDKHTKFSTVNHMHCFTHILNLVAKSLLNQFDVKPSKKNDEDLDDDKKFLLDMANNIKVEELTMAQEKDTFDENMNNDNDNNLD